MSPWAGLPAADYLNAITAPIGHAWLSAEFDRATLIKITTTSKTVHTNGYDSYQYEVHHPDQVAYFNLNARFAPIFERVGTMEPVSFLRRMLEQSFKQRDQLGLSDVIDGPPKKMAHMVAAGCQSPLTQRMESNLLALAKERL